MTPRMLAEIVPLLLEMRAENAAAHEQTRQRLEVLDWRLARLEREMRRLESRT